MTAPQRAPEHAPTKAHLAYVAPFVVFMGILALSSYLTFLGRWEFPLRVAVLTAVVYGFSRHVISFRLTQAIGSVAIGVAVFVIWIAPDLLIPGYRDNILFQNSVTGRIATSIPEHLQNDWLTVVFRAIRSVVLVPIIEELFWRGWLMRWLIRPNFLSVPLGAYTAQAMWISAILFASEHGPYWDVGLVAGVMYNWWMIRTRSLGDCILAHAVTNGCLSAYVVLAGQWSYWA